MALTPAEEGILAAKQDNRELQIIKHQREKRKKNKLIKKLIEGQLLFLMDLNKIELTEMLINIYKTGMVGIHWTGMNMKELEHELTQLEKDMDGTD